MTVRSQGGRGVCCVGCFRMTGVGPTLPSCMTQARGIMWETHKSSSEPFSRMQWPLGKIHPQRQNFRRRTLTCRLPHPLSTLAWGNIGIGCRNARSPGGGEHPALKEHFVWLSKDYKPYDHNPGSPFVPPDFTLGLLPIKDWPRRTREPPWVLDLEEWPKPAHNIPVDSTSSMDEGEKKKEKETSSFQENREPRA